MALAYLLHIFAALIWVGGMFFAHSSLRPAAAEVLQPPERLRLLTGVFQRFFPWVNVSIVVLFLTGGWIISLHGGMRNVVWYVHLMILLAVVMTLVFTYIYGVLFKRLKVAVAAQDWPTGGKAMAQIRQLVLLNLILGTLTVGLGSVGRFWLGL